MRKFFLNGFLICAMASPALSQDAPRNKKITTEVLVGFHQAIVAGNLNRVTHFIGTYAPSGLSLRDPYMFGSTPLQVARFTMGRYPKEKHRRTIVELIQKALGVEVRPSTAFELLGVSETTSPHRILEVGIYATKDEIKRAYNKLALEWHPDKNDLPAAGEVFHIIQKAYETMMAENFDLDSHLGEQLDAIFKKSS